MQTDPKVKEATLRIAIGDQRMQASRQLFLSAVLGGDDALAERYRLEMQVLLDQILDDSYIAMKAIRQSMGG